MQFAFEGKTYTYDARKIDVSTGVKITEATGLGLVPWERACQDMVPGAVQALFWAVKRQNGENVDLRSLNFSIVDFMDAFYEGYKAEVDAAAAEDPTVTTPSVEAQSSSANEETGTPA